MGQELNVSFFKHFFDSSIEFFCIVDQKGDIVKVNKEWERSLAYSQSELEGKPFLECVHPDDIKTTQEFFEQVSIAGRVECFQNRLKHKNGLYRWLEWRWVSEGLYMMASASDITKRKTIEEDIIRDKRLMEESQRLAKIGVWETDLVSKKLLLNDSALRIYGYHEIKENLSFDFFLEHIHPDDLEYAKNVWKETIIKGKFSDIEYRIRSKDGKLKTVLIAGDMELDADKQPIRAYGIMQDVTRQKEVENNLRASQKILNEAERIAKMGSWQILLSNGAAIWSENLYNIHGMKEVKPELSPEWLMSVVHPDDRDKMAKNFQRNIERGFADNDEYRVVHPDGSVHILSVTGEVIKDAGVPTGHIIGVTQDITERRQAEEKIQRLLAAIDQTTVQIIIADRSNKVEYVNNKLCQVTGYAREELIGRDAEFFSADENESGIQAEIVRCIEQGENFKGELLNKNAKGEQRWELVSITPIHNSNGELTNYIGIKEDITGRKKMEKDMLEAKEKAEESDRLKSAFLANMSHEIRTPMNGILGFTELLKNPRLSGKEQHDYIEIIERSGTRMLNIIDDIICISRIESGVVELNLSEVNINEQQEILYAFFKPETDAKKIAFSLKSSLSLQHSVIKTDKDKFISILTNLIKNAIKYTEEGSIEFGSEKKGKYLEFYVKDTGFGITKEKQEAIFKRFIQEDIEDKMARQGAGLGLSISKSYVEMLHGKIWVESKKGSGSTFYFTIPFNTEFINTNNINNSIPNVAAENQINSLKVLIVEDDETSGKLISMNIKDFCKHELIAKTGNDAVEICKNNPGIDLILMDIQLPKLNGYEATRQIREFNKDVIIIAQTAYGLSGDREKSIEAGCNDYIAKPIKKDELLSKIMFFFK